MISLCQVFCCLSGYLFGPVQSGKVKLQLEIPKQKKCEWKKSCANPIANMRDSPCQMVGRISEPSVFRGITKRQLDISHLGFGNQIPHFPKCLLRFCGILSISCKLSNQAIQVIAFEKVAFKSATSRLEQNIWMGPQHTFRQCQVLRVQNTHLKLAKKYGRCASTYFICGESGNDYWTPASTKFKNKIAISIVPESPSLSLCFESKQPLLSQKRPDFEG